MSDNWPEHKGGRAACGLWTNLHKLKCEEGPLYEAATELMSCLELASQHSFLFPAYSGGRGAQWPLGGPARCEERRPSKVAP